MNLIQIALILIRFCKDCKELFDEQDMCVKKRSDGYIESNRCKPCALKKRQDYYENSKKSGWYDKNLNRFNYDREKRRVYSKTYHDKSTKNLENPYIKAYLIRRGFTKEFINECPILIEIVRNSIKLRRKINEYEKQTNRLK